jgi:hypothetical protein
MRLFFLPDKLVHILISSSIRGKFFLIVGGFVGLGVLPLIVLSMLHVSSRDLSAIKTDGYTEKLVLGAQTQEPDFVFNVNVPSFFTKDVKVTGGLTVNGKAIFSNGVDLSGSNLDLGNGKITASNITYSLSNGEGITVTAGQTPTISNAGVLSLQGKTGKVTLEAGNGISIDGLKISSTVSTPEQNLFKTIATAGQNDITAATPTDTLTFAAGSGITLTTDTQTKKLTITGGGGTTLDGLSGVLSIANTTGSGSTITIDTASTTTKGIASFNSTNFSVSSGAVNLVQNIDVAAAPTFSGLTLSGLSTSGGILYTNGTGTLSQLNAGTNGYILTSSGSGAAPSWTSVSAVNTWQETAGALSPKNSTDSLNLGSVATSSATIHLAGTSGENSFFATGNVGIGTTNPAALLTVTQSKSSDILNLGTTSSPAILAMNGLGLINYQNAATLVGGNETMTGGSYTRVDSPGRQTLSAARATFTNVQMNESSYVYRDFGANYWSGNFTHTFDMQMTGNSCNPSGTPCLTSDPDFASTGPEFATWGLSNQLGAYNTWTDGVYLTLRAGYYGAYVSYYLKEVYGGVTYTTSYAESGGKYTDRYVAISRAGNALTAYIYSDASRTALITTLSLTLHNTSSYRYYYPLASRSDISADSASGYVQDIALNTGSSATTQFDQTTLTAQGNGINVYGHRITVNDGGTGGTSTALYLDNATYGSGAGTRYGLYSAGSSLSYFGGNVGLGSLLAKEKLDINGRLYLGDSAAPGTTTNRLYSVAGTLYWNGSALSGLTSSQWTTSGSNIYYSTGSVGIGTSAPLGLLTVSGSSIGKALTILNQTGDQNVLVASVSGTTKFVITNAGNVGIGTSAAGSALQVNGGAAIGYSSATAAPTNGITVAGNVGIGTTSATNKLTINGLSTTDAGAAVAISTGTSGIKGLVIQGVSSQGSNLQEWQKSDGALLAMVDYNGVFKAMDSTITPSYANTGPNTGGGSDQRAVDGTTTAGNGFGWWEYSGGSAYSVANDAVTFDFGAGASKVITESTLYHSGPSGYSQGTWKWQGSNNNSAYTDIGGSFTITTTGVSSAQTLSTLSGNTTGYRYYRLQGVSGCLNNCISNNGTNFYMDEFQFKIANGGTAINTTIANNYIDIGGNTLGTHTLSISGSKVGKALTVFNETGTNDIFTASSSGVTKFTINNSGQLYLADGTAPSITTNMLYANTGNLYWNGTALNGLISSQWTTSGNNIYYNTGNIGVGTSSPLGLLNVSGAATGKALAILNQTGDQALFTASASGSTKFVIMNDGNVGIGTTTVGNKLTVNGRIETRGGILFNQGSGATDNMMYVGDSNPNPVDASIGFFAAGVGATGAFHGSYFLGRGNQFSAIANQRGNLYFAAGNPITPGAAEGSINFLSGPDTTRMVIDNVGNVGIGTSLPVGLFNVSGSATGKALAVFNQTGDQDLFTASASGATKFVIANNGNIGIGTSAPAARLDIAANVTTAAAVISNAGTGHTLDLYGGGVLNTYVNQYGNIFTGGMYNIYGNSTFVCLSSCATTSMQLAGQVLLGTNAAISPLASLDVRATNGTQPIASMSGATSFAGFVVDNTGTGDLFTASNSGTTKFVIANNGNIGIGTTNTNNPLTVGFDGTNGNGAYVTTGGAWTNGSSRSYKENYTMLNQDDILRKINSLTIEQWNYKNEDPSIKHIGPFAEDFYNTFNVGNDSKHISTIDPAGVALIGIQALSKQVTDLRAQIETASLSANFAPSTQSLGISDTDATLSGNLTVAGRTTVNDLGVTGKLVSGLMSIDGAGGSITVVGDLKLQSNGYGKVDLFAGKVTVDNTGNITTTGIVTAKAVRAEAVEVLSSSTGKDDTIGQGTIKYGTTYIIIPTGAVKTTSKIFVTPRSKTGNKQLVVTQVTNGTSFKVEIDAAIPSDILFDWWVIN